MGHAVLAQQVAELGEDDAHLADKHRRLMSFHLSASSRCLYDGRKKGGELLAHEHIDAVKMPFILFLALMSYIGML